MTIKIKFFAYLFSVIAGIGWAGVVCGQSVKEAEEMMSAVLTAQANIKSYLQDKIRRDPSVANLAGIMPLDPWEDISFVMIANTRIPSDVERRGILAYAKMYESYQKDLQDLYGMANKFPGIMGSFFSGLGSITKNAGANTLNDLAQLYNGQIPFGEYSKQQKTIQIKIKDSTSNLLSALQSADERRMAESQRRFQAEQQAQEQEERRQMQRRQQDYERNRTRTTTCSELGGFLFCETR